MNVLSQRCRNMVPSATVAIADCAIDMRRAGIDVVDLSAGRAAEHTPDYVSAAAIAAIHNGETHQTHGQGTKAYRDACAAMLAREYGFQADPDREIIATMGVKQALTVALLALLNPGDEALIEDPCFVSYEPLINVAGGRAVPVGLLAENAFRWTEAQLEQAITPRTRALLLSSPQNPTGTVHTRADLEIVARVSCKHNLIVICDEVYETATWGGRRHLLMQELPGMRERTWGLHGLTKTFAMGGWRIGFIVAPEPHIKGMLEIQRHLITCCNSFVQAGASAAFGTPPPARVCDLWKDWEARCAFFTAAVDALPGFRCPMPEGGFYAWADITAFGLPSAAFADRLLREFHVAAVPGSSFGAHGEGYIRFTCVRSRAELEKGVERIQALAAALA